MKRTELFFAPLFAAALFAVGCEKEDAPVAATGIELDRQELTLTAGETATLTATLHPEGAEAAIEWSSSDPLVATVGPAGKVDALTAGTTDIVASIAGSDHSARCRLTVKAAEEVTVITTGTCSEQWLVLTSRTPVRIDWGDGNVQELDEAPVEQQLFHPYEAAGAYRIELRTIGLERLDFAGVEGGWTAIDMAQNRSLTRLGLDFCDFETLDLRTFEHLTYLSARYNRNLRSIDLRGLDALEELYLNENSLAELDLSTNIALKRLELLSTRIGSFDFSSLKELVDLNCGNNPHVTRLAAPELPLLQKVVCDNNPQMREMDLSGCGALEMILTGGLSTDNPSALASLDLTGCTGLEWLTCCFTDLERVDIGDCEALENCFLGDNLLTEVRVSEKNRMLWNLSLIRNRLVAAGLDALFTALPAENLSGKERKVFLVGNPGTETCDPSTAEAKGWTVDLTTDW